MSKTSCQIASNLYLVRQKLSDPTSGSKPVAPPPTNHIFVLDCSGSMYAELPKIREQLKTKLPKLMKMGDTFSAIWFSGKGQHGVLLTAEPIADLTALAGVNTTIDRWLQPQGMTGFKEPLEDVVGLVSKLPAKNVNNLVFMSDGCDNQWPRQTVIQAMEAASRTVNETTVVEYGYYADRALLSAMAQQAGGAHIFAEDFNQWAPVVEKVVERRARVGKRVAYKVDSDVIGGFVFAHQNGDLLTFGVEDGNDIAVPAGVPAVWYLSPVRVGKEVTSMSDAEAMTYAAISAFATRMQPQVVWPLLKKTGDVHFIQAFGKCFGKQAYSAFQAEVDAAVLDPARRRMAGFDQKAVPDDNAYTVLHLLRDLAADEDNKLVFDHPEMKYSAIGRRRVDATGSGLKFEADPFEQITGYSIGNLVYNEDRPNISMQVRKKGHVTLPADSPSSLHTTDARLFETFIFRAYAVVKDGLVNVDKLPMRLTDATRDKLREAGVGMRHIVEKGIDVVDVKSLPIINRSMIEQVSAQRYFETQIKLLEAQAGQKVYGGYLKEMFPSREKSASFKELYGAAGAEWLAANGFTDYSGFAPKHTKQVAATDVYMGKELKCSIKGFSSLPSLKEAREMIARAKINGPGKMMETHIFAAEHKKNVMNNMSSYMAWLDTMLVASRAECRRLMREIAEMTFTIIVGQVWFAPWKSLDENTMEVLGRQCKVELREIEIEI